MLKPLALNPWTYGTQQREALRGLLGLVGLSRSLLAYVADADRHAGESAPLTLIDGHLRADELSDEMVTVEILDVNDEEAGTLLLALDPMAQFAGYDEDRLAELRSRVSAASDALSNRWAAAAANRKAGARGGGADRKLGRDRGVRGGGAEGGDACRVPAAGPGREGGDVTRPDR